MYLSLAISISGCRESAWNDPYPATDSRLNVLYDSFSERPKHLDPVRSYSSNEYAFIAQIYEPPLQYHYLKRPYELVPLTVTEMPTPIYLDKEGQVLPLDSNESDVDVSVYRFNLIKGINYQPHPAFARMDNGDYRYHALQETTDNYHQLADFEHVDSREMTAADYVYQIKRLAHPRLHSPIAGLMMEYILGLKEYGQKLQQIQKENDGFLDLRDFPLEGAQVIDRYTFEVRVHGKYPQFIYWMAMPFFAPMPWEAERFYSQEGLQRNNITLDWYPVGTGPYMLSENNPNLRMVLEKNPNFHGEAYPVSGEESDEVTGLLVDAGKQMPFIERAVYSLEKEAIPYWNKFLQGYFDTSGISSDSFDQAVQFTIDGDAELTSEMQARGMHLKTAVTTSISYMGFNMLDTIVGGDSERARKLRQAIAIAIDYEEFISIFTNGRGNPAHGPLPPGIFGAREGQAGINPFVYNWVNDKAVRKSIEEAKSLLHEAGYPNARDSETGKPLVLYFDTMQTGPGAKAYLDWLRKQFEKLKIQLVIRATDYNRFQEKMRKGTAQIFQWGWNADYPDPENFMFLLHGPNSKVGYQGENAANYANPQFDQLFEQMKNMGNGVERQDIIDKMLLILRKDSPWLWGYYPVGFSLHHDWYHNSKPNLMANNTLKYKRINADIRAEKRQAWNHPVIWPVISIILLLLVSIVPAWLGYRKRERQTAI